MTIPVSTVPAVKAYLVTQLTATLTAATGKQLGVFYDEPGPFQPDDVVSVGDVTSFVSAPGAMVGGGGAGWIEERYTLEVVIDVFRGGDQAQTAYERAWALLAGVCSLVRTDPSLGSRVVEARPGQVTTTSEWDADHKGRHVRLSLGVDVGAWT